MSFKHLILFFLVIFALFFSCKKKQYLKEEQELSAKVNVPLSVLEGNWYAKNFIDSVGKTKSPLIGITENDPFYAYAFNFSVANPDSVLVFNGFEEPYALPIKINLDTIIAYNARPNASLYFIFSPIDQTLTCMEHLDSIWVKNTYKKTNVFALDAYNAFEIELNQKVFDGVFEQQFPVSTQSIPIRFLPDGTIVGLKDFNKYHLCTIGDCFLADDVIDVVELTNSATQKSVSFGFRYDNSTNSLNFYDFNASKIDEKGAQTIKDLKYKFLKKTVGLVHE